MCPAQTTNNRNAHGVKWSTDLYRTFDGERYSCFLFGYHEDRIARVAAFFRANGVKCRRLGNDLFVRGADEARAQELIQRPDYPNPEVG